MPEDRGELRRQVGQWVAEHWDATTQVGDWWDELASSGWAAPSWPMGRGGRGLPRWSNAIAGAALRAAGALGPAGGMGFMYGGPTIADFGNDDQKERFLLRIVTGRDYWCQLFSEPGAGSDLAGVQTRAELDGEEWVVTGQKVWTTKAKLADFGMLLARTDRDAKKHEGLTWFVLPMRQPGVVVRPLRQMNGGSEFNEVFLDEARVPSANIIGGVGNGWTVARATLAHERESLGTPQHAVAWFGDSQAIRGRVAGEIIAEEVARPTTTDGRPDIPGARILIDMAKTLGRSGDPHIRQDLARLYSLNRIARMSAERMRAGGTTAQTVGSIQKIAATQSIRLAAAIGERIQGPAASLWLQGDSAAARTHRTTLAAPAVSIAGGTDEIQRNIIAERVLGLPKEPEPDAHRVPSSSGTPVTSRDQTLTRSGVDSG